MRMERMQGEGGHLKEHREYFRGVLLKIRKILDKQYGIKNALVRKEGIVDEFRLSS